MEKLDITLKLLNKLEENKIEAYLVGGAVRDYVLGLDFKDLDIAYSDKEGKILEVLKDYNPRTYALAYGGIKLNYEGYDFELTHFREDLAYLDNRHPSKINKVYDLNKDALRRDFTINAMYLDKNLKVIDPLGGLTDLEKGIIRTCKEADTSFKEDSLRMLRAIKFSKRLGFSLDSCLVEAIKANNSLLINSINSLKGDLDEVLSYKNVSDLLVFEMFSNKKEELAYLDKHQALSLEDKYLILNIRGKINLSYKKEFNKLLFRLNELIDNYNINHIYQNYDIIDKVKLVKDFLGLADFNLIITNRNEIKISLEEIKRFKVKPSKAYLVLEDLILNGKLENNHELILEYMEKNYAS